MSDPAAANSPLFAPIDPYVAELGAADLPSFAISLCTLRYPDSGPLLRPLIERAAVSGVANEQESRQLVRALYIVGGRRDPLMFAPLLRLLRRPADEVEDLLGDVVAEGLPRIVAGVFDGNARALFEAIVDQQLDESVRDALLGAAAFLAFDKRIELQQLVGFLGRFGTERLAPDGELIWFGWAQAIALLGLRMLEPAVMAVFDREAMPDGLYERQDFANDLTAAERNPDDAGRFEAERLGYIEDVLVALEDIGFDDAESFWSGDAVGSEALSDDEDLPDLGSETDQIPTSFLPTAQGPAINPLRHVGRNDPCPCGSGKKAKRCCLKA